MMKRSPSRAFSLLSGAIAGMFLYLCGGGVLFAQVAHKDAQLNPEKVEQLLKNQIVKDDDETLDLRIQSSVPYAADKLRDPFESVTLKVTAKPDANAPKAAEPVKMPKFKIAGVFWGARFPQAIINNKIVKEGDTLEGATITAIQKDGITISFAGKEYTLVAPGSVAPDTKTVIQTDTPASVQKEGPHAK